MVRKSAMLLLVGLLVIQQPKTYSVSMTLDQWNKVIQIVNDAPVVGSERNPIIQTIQAQVGNQLNLENAQKAKEDSVTKKHSPAGGKKD